jgi:hypothetical protein
MHVACRERAAKFQRFCVSRALHRCHNGAELSLAVAGWEVHGSAAIIEESA